LRTDEAIRSAFLEQVAGHTPTVHTEEVYEHSNGEGFVIFQDRWFGHQKPGESGYQGPHVHVRPFEDTRNGQVPGAEEYYYYDR